MRCRRRAGTNQPHLVEGPGTVLSTSFRAILAIPHLILISLRPLAASLLVHHGPRPLVPSLPLAAGHPSRPICPPTPSFPRPSCLRPWLDVMLDSSRCTSERSQVAPRTRLRHLTRLSHYFLPANCYKKRRLRLLRCTRCSALSLRQPSVQVRERYPRFHCDTRARIDCLQGTGSFAASRAYRPLPGVRLQTGPTSSLSPSSTCPSLQE